MIEILHARRRRQTHDGNQTLGIMFDGDQSYGGEPFAQFFSPLARYSESVLRPQGEISRQRDLDGETVFYVRSGAVHGSEWMETASVSRAGAFARVLAERGSWYALKNESATHEAQIVEIAFSSAQAAIQGSCEERRFSMAQRRSNLCVVASPDGRRSSLRLAGNVTICSVILLPGQHIVHQMTEKSRVWLQVVEGKMTIGGIAVMAGDGVLVVNERAFSIRADAEAELLLVDIGTGQPMQG